MVVRSDRFGGLVQACRPALCYNVAIGGGTLQSPLFQAIQTGAGGASAGSGVVATPQHTTHIRVVATAGCWIALGANPTAAVGGATSFYLPANTPEYFWVVPGERLAVIQDTAAGSLNVAELAN